MQIDMTHFPLVFLRPHAHNEQHVPDSDEQVFQELLQRGERFILLTEELDVDDHPEESHEQRKQRALFFKQNKARIRELCLGIIIITGNRTVPAPLRLAAQGIGKAFGVSTAFVKSEQGAREQAGVWLTKVLFA